MVNDSDFLAPPIKGSAPALATTRPATSQYIEERCLTLTIADANGISPISTQTVATELRFIPRELTHAANALLLKCREFDGSYDAAANQVILFGSFTDEKGAATPRVRLSAKGVANRISWYGNTQNPTAVIYCESRIKAIVTSLAKPDYLCAGMNGVDGWTRGKDKEDHAIPAENLIPPIDVSGLPAALLPDSHHHKRVRRAMHELEQALRPHYQSVVPVKLPAPPDEREDWGSDDVAAYAGSPKVLSLYIGEALTQAKPTATFSANAARFPNLFACEPPAPAFVVSGILPLEVGVMSATGGMGKTTFMLWMAVHIILGRKILGHDVERAGAVLFLTGEDSRDIFQYRVHKICEQLQLTDAERVKVRDGLFVEDLSDRIARFAEADAKGNLSATNVVEQVIAEYGERGITLAVCDPLISFSPGERYVNDGAQALLTQARRLCHGLNAAVVLVNHVSKFHAGEGKAKQHAGRGGTAIGDGCRFEYELQPSTEKELQPLSLQVPADAKAYSLYVHKLSHAARPELPYIVVRSQFAWTWAEREQQTLEQAELHRQLAVERVLQECLDKLLVYMRGLDTATVPVTRNSLQDSCMVIGVPKNKVPAVVDFGLRAKALEERELPAHHRVGKRTHSLHLASKKY